MSKNPGPVKRGTRWYLRVRVPLDLVDRIGRREIWKSLGTGDHREAKRCYLDKRAEIQRQFDVARDGLEALSDADIRRMVARWFDAEDRQWAEADFTATFDDLQDALDDAHDWEKGLRAGTDGDVMSHVQTVVDAVLIGNGWPGRPHRIGDITAVGVQIAEVDKGSDSYKSLVGQVRRAMLEAARRHQARLGGCPAGQVFDPAFKGAGVGQQAMAPAQNAAGTAPPLTEVLEKWKSERKPGSKTAHEWTTAVRRFREVCGDLPVDAITTANVREFKDALLMLPNVMKRNLRRKTVPQIIAATKGHDVCRLSATTVKKQLNAIKTLLSWSKMNDYVNDNAAAGLSIPTSKNADTRRLPYSVEDMNVLFAGLGAFRETKPSKLWLPLLAAFTGARPEELGQLHAADVRRRDGIDYISVNTDDEGKSLKTRSSQREVPVHPELVRCGFLDYVDQQKLAGGGLLFPDLRRGSHGKLTASFSQWWGRYARRIGVTDERKVFYSFRHGFKEACRVAGVSEEVHDALTGHSGGGAGRTYGTVPLEVKAREIAKVKYPGSDLSRLRRTQA